MYSRCRQGFGELTVKAGVWCTHRVGRGLVYSRCRQGFGVLRV